MEPDDEAKKVKHLREESGASLLVCKKTLRKFGGDMDLALVALQTRGDDPPEAEPEVVD